MNDSSPAKPTLARRIAAYCITERGYRDVAIPEAAQPLARASDICLCRADGVLLSILCIVDGTESPRKTFGLSVDQVRSIADSLRQRHTKPTKMSVNITVIELAFPPAHYTRQKAFSTFKRESLLDKRSLSACVINAFSNDVWFSNWSASLRWKKFLSRVVKSKDLSDADVAAQIAVAPINMERSPFATLSVLTLLVAVYACEVIFGIEGPNVWQQNIPTLVAMGGLSKSLVVENGEWFRMITSILLHGGLLHLLFNGIALAMGGVIIERLLGASWFLAIFVLGGLGGSVTSMLFNPPNIVSVGASGAILGLFGALLGLSFRFPSGSQRTGLLVSSFRVLVPTLLTIGKTHGGAIVDFGAHLGGALTGLVAGGFLVATWLRTESTPKFRIAAAGLSAVAAAFALSAILPLSQGFDQFSGGQELAPLTKFEDLRRAAINGWDDYVTQYPNDPRGHLLTGAYKLDHHDFAGAEREERIALEKNNIKDSRLASSVKDAATYVLAMSLSAQNRLDEARQLASPLCGADSKFRKDAVAKNLCK